VERIHDHESTVEPNFDLTLHYFSLSFVVLLSVFFFNWITLEKKLQKPSHFYAAAYVFAPFGLEADAVFQGHVPLDLFSDNGSFLHASLG
jgi:hypothetical protein